MPDFHLMDRNH